MYVSLSMSRFTKQEGDKYLGKYVKFPQATNNTATLIAYASKALEQLFKENKAGTYYKKCGITVIEIVPEEKIQLSLFAPKGNSKKQLLENTIDKLNQKLGKNILRHAVQGSDNNTWKLRCENMSPNYTTRLGEILVVDVGNNIV